MYTYPYAHVYLCRAINALVQQHSTNNLTAVDLFCRSTVRIKANNSHLIRILLAAHVANV